MASAFDSLKKAAQAVVGAPHVFNAARDAGASASAAADVMAASAAAIRAASAATDGTPGPENAIRHFIWQAYISGRHGSAVAEAVAAAHEEGRNTPHDTRVDLHNNAAGRACGEAHSATIGQGSLMDALNALVPVAQEKWASDELIWVKPH
ncbi:DUF6973 domain-containing protein [Nocardioides sp. B-3]|uniref:DUF6973 domain-containing protein n=1 Tax=Nocardioides sp. B-3 TaxID=2895565 RepID=UPI002152A052|nr:hypothetical protein [Nocardioides sp. B-3]UUZ59966.1 hypothetical protein LP418_02775 [Nocardioides sp. B-3]